MANYPGNPSVTLSGTVFTYDTEGKTGPQLLGDAPGHPRQSESDANWPGAPAMIAKADDAAARVELLAIDMRSIRALRERDNALLAILESAAQAARARLLPARPPPAQP